MDKISVVIPCYNVGKYIDRCLDSVFRQTYPIESTEVLCVNDASADDTLDKLKEWEKRYPDNMMVIDCEENGHLGKARNIGLSYATGDWIAFIDSDDWIDPEYLKLMYEAASTDEYQIAGCTFIRDAAPPDEGISGRREQEDDKDAISDDAVAKHPYHISSIAERKAFFHEQPLKLYAWGKIIKREFLLENEIFFPEHVAYEDIVWGNLVNMYLERAVLIDRPMYHYFINPGSIVLKKNEAYHIDHITTQEIMWTQLTGRGFNLEYMDNFKYEYLYNGYLAMLKILALRYDNPPYSYFRLLQELTRSKVSAEECVRFMSDPQIPELHRLLFGMIHRYVSKDGFGQMVEILRKSGL